MDFSEDEMNSMPVQSGKIYKRRAGFWPEEASYEIRYLIEEDLAELVELQRAIYQDLSDKEIYKLTSAERLKELLAGEDLVMGVFSKDGLIAYHIICFPAGIEENLGADIDLTLDDLKMVSHLKAVAVRPDYRGCGLQRKMASLHLEVIRDRGYCHVCSTVSPKNFASIKNFFASGFVIKGLKVKYGGLLRYIVYKNISRPPFIWREDARIDIADVAGQMDLLNGGLSGFQMERRGESIDMIYGRAVLDQGFG